MVPAVEAPVALQGAFRRKNRPVVEAPVDLQGVFLRKHRFCATFPTVNKCKQGKACPYAHSREEVLGPVCSEMEERLEGVNPEFFMWTYKTLWCPIGSFHDWQECIYAHNYQDLRRDPPSDIPLRYAPTG